MASRGGMHHVLFGIPKYENHCVKLTALINRLQQIMVNDNRGSEDLVGAEIVKDNYRKLYRTSHQQR